jgi:hypothetical protein
MLGMAVLGSLGMAIVAVKRILGLRGEAHDFEVHIQSMVDTEREFRANRN